MRRTHGWRRAGLSGLEVVAVVAVIGLLAGAFRARGEGRGDAAEQTCLGNVKSICSAIRMYMGDPSVFVICADTGARGDSFGTGSLAYPDICALECANEVCGWVDWEECTWAADCGLYNHAPNDGSFLRNPELRRPYARHRDGVNLGFLDGHAAWFASEDVIAQSPSKGNPARGRLSGYGPSGPTSDCGFAEDHPGVPTLY